MQGGVQNSPMAACPFYQRQTSWQAVAANGKSMMGLAPSDGWNWSSLLDQDPSLAQAGPCPAASFTDAASYLRSYVSRARPGANVQNVRPRPDVAAKAQTDAQRAIQMMGIQPTFDAAEMTLTYQSSGGPVEEVLVTTVMSVRQPAPDLYGGMSGYFMSAWTGGVLSTSAQGGPANRQALDRAIMSGQQNPEYQNLLMQEAAAKARASAQARRNTPNYAGSSTAGGKSVGDIMHEGYMKRSGMSDAGQSRSVDGIREVTPYANQWGERVEVPSQYGSAWEMNDGNYVATDDPFFEPADGQQMEEWNYGD
jgi:hypothetical protein